MGDLQCDHINSGTGLAYGLRWYQSKRHAKCRVENQMVWAYNASIQFRDWGNTYGASWNHSEAMYLMFDGSLGMFEVFPGQYNTSLHTCLVPSVYSTVQTCKMDPIAVVQVVCWPVYTSPYVCLCNTSPLFPPHVLNERLMSKTEHRFSSWKHGAYENMLLCAVRNYISTRKFKPVVVHRLQKRHLISWSWTLIIIITCYSSLLKMTGTWRKLQTVSQAVLVTLCANTADWT